MLLSFALLSPAVSPGVAATFEWQGYSETIPPQDAVERELSCPDGDVVTGGYSLDNVHGGPFSSVVAIANAPVPENRWRVGFYNDHDTDVRVDFRISVLCD